MSAMFWVRSVIYHVLRPTQCPLGGGLTVEIPELRSVVQGVHRLTGTTTEYLQRPRQLRDVERRLRRRADQVTRCADLKRAVVEHPESAWPRTRHRQPHCGQRRHLLQRDLRALAVGIGSDILPNVVLAATVSDQRHAE